MIIYVGDLDPEDRSCYCPECADPVNSTTVDEPCAECQEILNADASRSGPITATVPRGLSRTA